MGRWHPIETAPKDEKVLVTRFPYTGRHAPINMAWFSTSELRKHCKPWVLSAARRKLRYHPTHWMPLPDPPEGG